jgi:hypothetical protein
MQQIMTVLPAAHSPLKVDQSRIPGIRGAYRSFYKEQIEGV